MVKVKEKITKRI